MEEAICREMSKQKLHQINLTGKEDFIQGCCNRGETSEINLNSTPLEQRVEYI